MTSSGSMIWVKVIFTALPAGQKDQLLIVCQVEDITEEKRRQDELQHYAALVRYSDAPIYSIDLEGNVASWNSAAERTYGYSEQEMIGKTAAILIPEDQRQAYRHVNQRVFDGQILQIEARHRHKQGRSISMTLCLSPIRDECSRIVGISVLARDNTQLKRLQNEIVQLDRLNLVASIAAGIGHEVRNPMTTVRGYLQMMLRRPETEPLQAQVKVMIEELDRANGIISEFLSLARNKPTEMALHDLNQEIRSLIPLIEAEAVLQGSVIEVDLGAIPEIMIDVRETRQLLLNLVRNGLEAMARGGKLTISTAVMEGKLVLAVADQGPGIPDDNVPRLGTPFFTTKEFGTGLGLCTCRTIADNHQAEIEVQTDPAGSTFFVKFPLPDPC